MSMPQAASWEHELHYLESNKRRIAGIDEVGRGCWAGPLVACAYIFHTVPSDISVFDSKKTTEKLRHALVPQLMELGLYGIGEVTAQEIDEFGLQRGQYMAYERALAALPEAPDMILLDGRSDPKWPYVHHAIIDGDATVASIAAASIIAKNYRDTYMKTTAHAAFPTYGFADHVGYGTKQHSEALQEHGVSILHRRSFAPIAKLVSTQ